MAEQYLSVKKYKKLTLVGKSSVKVKNTEFESQAKSLTDIC
jgi:hypothetical protein